jgi:16S rRNA (cytosine1402-N4)-methyltransferase
MVQKYHEPVLLNESIEGLNIHGEGIYVDVTFGGGGHSREILKKMKGGKLIAFDQDKNSAENVWQDEQLEFVNENFRHLKKILRLHNVKEVDGILADLGVSSRQFDDAARGFSVRGEAELDMRMNQDSALTARQIINTYAETELIRIFSQYGEVRNSKQLANHISQQRKQKPFSTTIDFIERISPVIRGNHERYLARVFQSLRIEVNDELAALSDLLEQSYIVLKKDGRLVVISFHSLEDRLVKYFMKTGNVKGEVEKNEFGVTKKYFRPITKKPITPSEEEIKSNPRSRSAKLRIAEKI